MTMGQERELMGDRYLVRHNPEMSSSKPYLSEIEAPERAEVDAMLGLTLLEFGTSWCGHCRAAEPARQ